MAKYRLTDLITEDYEINRRRLVDNLIEYILEEDLQLHRVEGDEFNNLEYVASDYWNDEAEMFDDEAGNAILTEFELIGREHPGKISYLYTEEWIDMYPFMSIFGEDGLIYYDAVSGVRYIEVTPEEMQEILDAADLSMESLQEVQEGWDQGVDFRSPESIADRLAEIGAYYYEFSKENYVDAEDFYDPDPIQNLAFQLEKIGDSLDQYPLLYTIVEDPGDGDKYLLFSDAEYISVSAEPTNFTEDDLDLIRSAGEMGRLDEAWDDGIQWGEGDIDIHDAANRLSEIGAKFIHFDFDPGELNQRNSHSYFMDVSELMQDKYGNKPDLYYSYEDFHDGNELHKALVFSDGDYIDVDHWSDDDIEMVKDAGEMGRLDENKQDWDDNLDFNNEFSANFLADRLAEIGAVYVKETPDIEPEPEYRETYSDYMDEVGNLFKQKYGDEQELYYTYIVDEDTFVFSDGTYYYNEDGFLSDDVDLIIGAGQLTEDVDLKDDRINQLFKAYSRDNFDAAAPDDRDPFPGVGDVKVQYYTLTAALSNKNFPVAIQKYAQDFWDGDWLNYTAKENTRDEALDEESFESDFSTIKKEFYGMEDEIDAELLRDAGYDEQAEEWEEKVNEQKLTIMDDEFQLTLATDVEVANHRGKQQLHQIVNFYLQDEGERETLLDVKYETHTPLDEIESVEDLKKLLDDFHAVIEEDFQPCKRPVVVTQYDPGDDQGTQINESFEDERDVAKFLDDIVEQELRYYELLSSELAEILDRSKEYQDGVDRYEIDPRDFADRVQDFIESKGDEYYTVIHPYDLPFDLWKYEDMMSDNYNKEQQIIIFSDDWTWLPPDFDQEAEDIKQAGMFESKEPINELSPEAASWVDIIASQGLKYIEIPDSVINRIDGELEGDETDMAYILDEISKIIDETNKKYGVGKKYGETDEDYDGDFFTILDPDDFTYLDPYESGFDSILMVFDDDYEYLSNKLSHQDLEDIKDAGRFNIEEQITEQEDEQEDFEPTWDEVWEVIESDVEDAFDEMGRDIDSYNDGTLETNQQENGVSGHHLNDLVFLEDNYLYPTEAGQKKAERALKGLLDYHKEYAGESIQEDAPKVWAMFGGVVDEMDYETLLDAEEAYREGGDEEMADELQTAAEVFNQDLYDYVREDSDSMVFLHFDAELDTDNLLPILTLTSTLEGQYGDQYDGIKVEVPFESMEDLQESLPDKLQEVIDFMSGDTRRRERKKQQES